MSARAFSFVGQQLTRLNLFYAALSAGLFKWRAEALDETSVLAAGATYFRGMIAKVGKLMNS
jgi:hypothetical protein